MAYEQRDNSGTLGRNDRKDKPNHPDHRGQCIIDGKPYWISAWIKEGPSGKFFSLSFTAKEQMSGDRPPTRTQDFEPSDIPF
jgi:hypothetical protein